MRSVSKNCIFILISSITASCSSSQKLSKYDAQKNARAGSSSFSQIFFVFLVLLFWWSFSFFITQEVIVLHVIRVSSSELGLCNSPGFINSRWESIFPGESVMPLLRILYLVKTLECTTVKWTHVPCVIIVFCTCKEDLFPLYLLIWKAVLPFSKTFLHHVCPMKTFRLFSSELHTMQNLGTFR